MQTRLGVEQREPVDDLVGVAHEGAGVEDRVEVEPRRGLGQQVAEVDVPVSQARWAFSWTMR